MSRLRITVAFLTIAICPAVLWTLILQAIAAAMGASFTTIGLKLIGAAITAVLTILMLILHGRAGD